MVDAQIRLQNIALEHAELIARRSMSWAESTNRTTMFMTVLSAALVALALFAQTGVAGGGMNLLALVIFSVVLLVGVTSLLRIAQLDTDDMRWVQGLNRLRSLRLELDPGLAPYLVTSPHDDFMSVLKAYAGDDDSPVYAFGTLVVLLVTVNSVLVGFVGGLLAITLGADAVISVVVGVVAVVVFIIGVLAWLARGFRNLPGSLAPLLPAPPESEPADRPAVVDDRPTSAQSTD